MVFSVVFNVSLLVIPVLGPVHMVTGISCKLRGRRIKRYTKYYEKGQISRSLKSSGSTERLLKLFALFIRLRFFLAFYFSLLSALEQIRGLLTSSQTVCPTLLPTVKPTVIKAYNESIYKYKC